MNKNILVGNTNIIAVYGGVLYEYHDESWHEKEFQSTDDELEGDGLIYKDTNGLKNFPKIVFTPYEPQKVTPRIEALMKRFLSIPFSTENEE